ncbi:MAG TPA: YegS/Rv2252/BmrU family lipid kinase [Methylomirabilota bacterium]|nr:YegS/Rv2252/BmrU family lipid kinase [Methylomirabilota bacterium]
MSRALVVVNPAAGGGRTERAWPKVREALWRTGLDFECATTVAAGDAIGVARDAVRAGHQLVVAVGGDGTLNEVVNGATGADGRPLATIGAVLTGRGRDACRNFGVPHRLADAATALVGGHDAVFDLGLAAWADGRRRYFLGAAGAGFDAAVAARAASVRARGTLPYLVAVLATVRAWRAVAATVDADGAAAWRAPLTAAVVANGRYFGGGMKIAPDADARDGRLDLVILGGLGRLEMIRWLPTIYSGRHLAHPRVATRRASCVVIDGPTPLPTELDGELAAASPVTMSVAAGALRLRVPAGTGRARG